MHATLLFMRNVAIAIVMSCFGCAGEAPPSSGGQAQDAAPGDSAVTADTATTPDAPTTTFSFFITSTGKPTGGDFRATAADLDGLSGADAFCTSLAVAAVPAAATRTWRAYLSTATVNAKDRIGTGPWFNVNAVKVADSVANLHDAAANNLKKETSLDEKGQTVPGSVDNPVQHDILTGSLADGTKSPDTCANWTSSAATGVAASVGHHDRAGGGAAPTSWNAAHSTNGCSAAAFVGTGGRGSIMCFAL